MPHPDILVESGDLREGDAMAGFEWNSTIFLYAFPAFIHNPAMTRAHHFFVLFP